MPQSIQNLRWRRADQFEAERQRMQQSEDPFIRACGYIADCYPDDGALLLAGLATEEDVNAWRAWGLTSENHDVIYRSRRMARLKLYHALRGAALFEQNNKNVLTAQRQLLAILNEGADVTGNSKRSGLDKLRQGADRETLLGARRNVADLTDEELARLAADGADVHEAGQRPS